MSPAEVASYEAGLRAGALEGVTKALSEAVRLLDRAYSAEGRALGAELDDLRAAFAARAKAAMAACDAAEDAVADEQEAAE